MKAKHFALAFAAMAYLAGGAHAETQLQRLDPGAYSATFPVDVSTGAMSDRVYVSLNQASRVTGTIKGLATVDKLTTWTFSEMVGETVVDGVVEFDPSGLVASFDLGVLTKTAMPPGMMGFPDPDGYWVNLSGLLGPAGLAQGQVSIALNVAAVPEASTWLMMALGLGGLAAVGRRRHG